MVRSGHATRGDAPDGGASPRPDAVEHLLCLVLNGVSPTTWALFRPLLQQLDHLGGAQATLLVSPASQVGSSLLDDRRFCAAMDGRLLRGDELVLGGYGPSPGDAGEEGADGPTARVGACENEMAPQSSSEREAHLRLRAGLRQFMDLDWPVEGFIAPGWHLGNAVRAALRHLPFRYTADRKSLLCLKNGRLLPTPTVVWSDLGAPWHAALSRAQRSSAIARLDEAPCLRLVVHPVDLQHLDGPGFWLRTLDRLLAERRPSTLSDWLGEAGALTS